jgi:anti-sigma B factor antagonist
MTTSVETHGAISIVRLAGDLNAKDDGKFVRTITDLLDRGDAQIVIDLGGVPMVTSGGLGELVRVTAQANAQGSRILLANIPPFVEAVLRTTKLNTFFSVCPSVDAAVAQLS